MSLSKNLSSVILLSAGASSRTPTHKALTRIHGRPWIESQLHSLKSVGVPAARVVLGFEGPEIEKVIRAVQVDLSPLEVIVCHNPEPARGSFSSLQVGLSHWDSKATSDDEGVYILPVDVPVPLIETWGRLQLAIGSGPQVVKPVFRDRGGHPIWLRRDFVQSLLLLDPNRSDSRLDFQVQALGLQFIKEIRVDDSRVRLNMNKLGDFEEFEKHQTPG